MRAIAPAAATACELIAARLTVQMRRRTDDVG